MSPPRTYCLVARALALVCLGCCAIGPLHAKHIIGGEVTYEFLRATAAGNEYRIQFFMYRDCNPASGGAEFDSDVVPGAANQPSPFTYTIYQGTRQYGGQTFTLTFESLEVSDVTIDFNDPCAVIPPALCVERGLYTTTVTLPVSDETFTIVYQRCCRTEQILNIVNPGETGATYAAQISPLSQRLGNSSPRFELFPPLVICNDFELDFNHGALDADGDSLVYSLVDPFTGGGPDLSAAGSKTSNGVVPDPDAPPPYAPVTFVSGSSAALPIPGIDPIRVDSSTGLMQGRPGSLGNYVLAVRVQEYRDGELLGQTLRDFQFNIVECDPSIQARVTAVVGADSVAPDLVLVCGATEVELVDISIQREFVRALRWTIEGTTDGVTRYEEPALQLQFPDFGTYPGKLVVNPGLECSDSVDFQLVFAPPIEADFTFDYDTCSTRPIAFVNQSTTTRGVGQLASFSWDFGDGARSTQRDPQHRYAEAGDREVTLVARDTNGCSAEHVADLGYFPAPAELLVALEAVGDCAPARVTFRQADPLVTEDYAVRWDFGDGSSSELLEPVHTYPEPGLYDVALEVTSRYGCAVDTVLPEALIIKESPTAAFAFAPNAVTIVSPEVRFTDQSTDAARWAWRFDSLGTSRETNPTFTFPDSGAYRIRLAVTHRNGCVDTTARQLRVEPFLSYHLPNAFTPNGDGENERFLGAGYTRYVTNFGMDIWNRWGELIFRTDDLNAGWDGSNRRNGGLAPPGVYLYVVTYEGLEGPQTLTGHVTLVE